MGFEQSAEKCAQIVQEVARTRPDLLLVGLGSPKQEVFLSNNWHELNATVAVGVGIALEFLAGTQRRAPLWMQRAGLEWSWRLLKEPGRLWKRYLIQDPRFFWLLLRARWSRT
jgi:N-acetylglucosaminyldiphosphoundecaprenol N-acetyl-beta-D-mannosaminyltransferase